jgi:hypothetical protein
MNYRKKKLIFLPLPIPLSPLLPFSPSPFLPFSLSPFLHRHQNHCIYQYSFITFMSSKIITASCNPNIIFLSFEIENISEIGSGLSGYTQGNH